MEIADAAPWPLTAIIVAYCVVALVGFVFIFIDRWKDR